MVELPFSGVSKEVMTVPLAGRRIRVRSRFSNLTEVWTLDFEEIIDDATIPLVKGVVVAVGVDMLAPYGFDLGGLFAVPNERPLEDPKRGELGLRVKLIHHSPEELAAT